MTLISPASPSDLENSQGPSQVRACVSCSRAKSKCVPDQEQNGKCQRCLRLKKICEPSAPQIRSQPRKRTSKTTVPKSRVGKLEEKLEGLASLIKSTQDLNSAKTTEPNSQVMSDMTSSSTTKLSVSSRERSTMVSDLQEQAGRGGSVSQKGAALSSFVPIRQFPSLATSHGLNNYSTSYPILLPSFAEVDTLLLIFRDQLTPHFPFIILPQSVSAENLYLDRPFFYICILAVTIRDSVQQQGLGKMIMKQLSERLFEKGERNLDLLLGTLTYAAWCYYNCWNIPQVTCLLTAAMTLVLDLGLTRPLPVKKAPNRSLFYEALRDSCSIGLLAWTKTTRTLEENRAFLGYYFLSSVISSFLRRMDPPQKFSPFIEDCVKVLEDCGDHPNDKTAVALVRLQEILERVHQSSWHKKPEPPEINSGTLFIIASIERELRQLRKMLPAEQANNATVLLHCHVIEMSIYEAGLCNPPLNADPIPSFKRLELLCDCLEATKSYFEIFFSIQPSNYVAVCLPTWSQLSYSLAILHMLSNFERPGWNLASVREAIDYDVVFGRLIGNLEHLITLPGFEKLDVFSRSARWMKCVKEYVDAKMAALPQTAGHDSDQMTDFVAMPGTEDLTDFFQFLDDTWMMDTIDPSSFQAGTIAGT